VHYSENDGYGFRGRKEIHPVEQLAIADPGVGGDPRYVRHDGISSGRVAEFDASARAATWRVAGKSPQR
jgi:hypothetical protein